MDTSTRLLALDSLRGLACLSVVTWHYTNYRYGYGNVPGSPESISAHVGNLGPPRSVRFMWDDLVHSDSIDAPHAAQVDPTQASTCSSQ